jgi:hypothetical protein
MSRFWRRIAPVVAAGGLIAGMGAIPAEAASPAAYSITIAAKVAYPTVTHDDLVLYQFRGFDTAVIHGTITGATAGDVATLLAKPFGATHYAATGKPIALSAASSSYAFTVEPSLATAYRVQVTTGAVVDATSATQTVYVVVVAAQASKITEKCSRTPLHCTESFKIETKVPSRAYADEAGKHVYFYLAIGYPHPPNTYTLSAKSTASKARRVNAGEFEMTLTFYVPLRNTTGHWLTTFCTKDTESRDGLGLPGHHGCGSKKVGVKAAALYLG